MKKTILSVFFTLLFLTQAGAHTLILGAFDNEDGTITVVGKFDTGALAQGAMVRLEALGSGTILFQKRLPEESELIVSIPKEPYQIVLDGGPGHKVIKKGIIPENGYASNANSSAKTAQLSKARGVNLPVMVCTAGAFCMLALTLLFCRRNTDRLLTELKRAH